MHVVDVTGTGVAVLSKMRTEKVEKTFLTSPTIPSFFVRFDLGGRKLDLVAMHAANPLRSLDLRDQEFDAFAAWQESSRPVHLVLAGDLNATPYCPAFKKMLRRTGLRSVRRGRGFFGSFPTRGILPVLRIPIDHILVSAAIQVEEVKLGADIHSDHLPFISVLRV
jgi:endonuclease/exonuclease/phosphatase family metal-dependent hydrolase